MKFQYIPDFDKCQRALDAYNENDLEHLERLIARIYKIKKDEYGPIQARFASSFIKSQANIFSNPFVRSIQNDLIDDTVLTEVEKRVERNYHLFQKAAIIIGFKDYNPLIDDNEKEPYFDDLTPLEYYHEGRWWVYGDVGGTYFFKSKTIDGQEIDEVYITEEKFTKALGMFDSDKEGLGVNAELTEDWSDYKYIPIIEWKNKNIDNVVISPCIALEERFIRQMTWGMYNGDPKLINQVVIKSDSTMEELKQNLINMYKTTGALKIGFNESVEIFDTGDLTVLESLQTSFYKMIEQLCLTHGVDVSAVIRKQEYLAVESKKMDLNYINRYRNDFKLAARNFDKQIFRLLKYNHGIDCGWENFIAQDIELVSDRTSTMDYAVNMYKNGFWTHAEAIAFVREVTVEEAQEFIDSNDIVGDVGAFN